jgi:hypothetical protein
MASAEARLAYLEHLIGDGRDGVLPAGLVDAVAEILNKVESRVTALEQGQIRFLNIWQPGRSYPANGLVVHRGSLWIALQPTSAPPGTAEHWQLAVKSGEVAKA